MLISSTLFLVMSNATTKRKDLGLFFNEILLAAFIIALLIVLKSSNYLVLKEGVSLFGGLFHNTNLNIVFHGFILFISLIIVQLTALLPRKYNIGKVMYNNYPAYDDTDSIAHLNGQELNSNSPVYNISDTIEQSDRTKEQYNILEYPLIIIFIIIGAMFLINSSDIISIFLSIELQSYGLYLLCALYRNSESSTGAGLTYFLLGGLSSCFILLASGILYANSGTSGLDNYYLLTNVSDIKHTVNNFIYWYNNDYFNYCLVILSIGFLFKISASPFHFWSPDVYDAIPTIVTTFVATIAKISILIFLTEIVHYTSKLVISNFNWTNSLLLSSLLSLIVGTVLGLNQSRIKRLLAYSTISHLGFMLLAISINSIESIQAFLFYLMQYSLTNVNAFIIIISIGYTMHLFKKQYEKNKNMIFLDAENSPIQYISQLRGYYFINPLIAVSFTIVMYSFVGIPPLIGFFGKQMVLSSALDKGYMFITLVAILTSVISAVYYLNIVKEIFFSKPEQFLPVFDTERVSSEINDTHRYHIILSTNLTLTIAVLTLIILLFMSSPNQWLSITNILSISLFN